MSKSEFAIVGVAAATCLILFFKLNTVEDANARPNSAESAAGEEKAALDPCEKAPCVTFLGNLRVGDNFLAAGEDKTLQKKDKSYFFESLRPLLKSSKIVIANLETPIIGTPPKSKADKTNLFWSDRKTAEALKQANVTAVTLLNSHIFDFGDAGLASTVEALDKFDISYLGIEKKVEETVDTDSNDAPQGEEPAQAAPAAIDAAPIEIPTVYRQALKVDDAAFDLVVLNGMSASPPQPDDAPLKIANIDLEALKKQATDIKSASPDVYIAAYIGNAKVRGPSTVAQQNDARALIDAGVDLVVGYGSRFLQEVERYKDKWIVYGLGDAVSAADLPIPARNERWPFSGAVRIVLEIEGNTVTPALKLYPILNDGKKTGFKPRLLDKKAFGDLFWYLQRKEQIEYDFILKQKLHPGLDSTGRYISLAKGAK